MDAVAPAFEPGVAPFRVPLYVSMPHAPKSVSSQKLSTYDEPLLIKERLMPVFTGI